MSSFVLLLLEIPNMLGAKWDPMTYYMWILLMNLNYQVAFCRFPFSSRIRIRNYSFHVREIRADAAWVAAHRSRKTCVGGAGSPQPNSLSDSSHPTRCLNLGSASVAGGRAGWKRMSLAVIKERIRSYTWNKLPWLLRHSLHSRKPYFSMTKYLFGWYYLLIIL